MADCYVGEIRIFPYANARVPVGWQRCDGSLLQISQFQLLYSLLGTVFGGDGQNTFGVPDLRGRIPIGASSTYPQGTVTGVESVALVSSQLPPHTHAIQASIDAASATSPSGQVFGAGQAIYVAPATPAPQAMAANVVAPAGQGAPHENCAPTLTLMPCIAVEGIYPPRP